MMGSHTHSSGSWRDPGIVCNWALGFPGVAFSKHTLKICSVPSTKEYIGRYTSSPQRSENPDPSPESSYFPLEHCFWQSAPLKTGKQISALPSLLKIAFLDLHQQDLQEGGAAVRPSVLSHPAFSGGCDPKMAHLWAVS